MLNLAIFLIMSLRLAPQSNSTVSFPFYLITVHRENLRPQVILNLLLLNLYTAASKHTFWLERNCEHTLHRLCLATLGDSKTQIRNLQH